MPITPYLNGAIATGIGILVAHLIWSWTGVAQCPTLTIISRSLAVGMHARRRFRYGYFERCMARRRRRDERSRARRGLV